MTQDVLTAMNLRRSGTVLARHTFLLPAVCVALTCFSSSAATMRVTDPDYLPTSGNNFTIEITLERGETLTGSGDTTDIKRKWIWVSLRNVTKYRGRAGNQRSNTSTEPLWDPDYSFSKDQPDPDVSAFGSSATVHLRAGKATYLLRVASFDFGGSCTVYMSRIVNQFTPESINRRKVYAITLLQFSHTTVRFLANAMVFDWHSKLPVVFFPKRVAIVAAGLDSGADAASRRVLGHLVAHEVVGHRQTAGHRLRGTVVPTSGDGIVASLAQVRRPTETTYFSALMHAPGSGWTIVTPVVQESLGPIQNDLEKVVEASIEIKSTRAKAAFQDWVMLSLPRPVVIPSAVAGKRWVLGAWRLKSDIEQRRFSAMVDRAVQAPSAFSLTLWRGDFTNHVMDRLASFRLGTQQSWHPNTVAALKIR